MREVTIAVEADKTCSVSLDEHSWLTVAGLTPEQAVAVKALCSEIAKDARDCAITEISASLPKPSWQKS